MLMHTDLFALLLLISVTNNWFIAYASTTPSRPQVITSVMEVDK